MLTLSFHHVTEVLLDTEKEEPVGAIRDEYEHGTFTLEREMNDDQHIELFSANGTIDLSNADGVRREDRTGAALSYLHDVTAVEKIDEEFLQKTGTRRVDYVIRREEKTDVKVEVFLA